MGKGKQKGSIKQIIENELEELKDELNPEDFDRIEQLTQFRWSPKTRSSTGKKKVKFNDFN